MGDKYKELGVFLQGWEYKGCLLVTRRFPASSVHAYVYVCRSEHQQEERGSGVYMPKCQHLGRQRSRSSYGARRGV